MARGKQKGIASLKDTVADHEIVRLGEVKNEPNYIFPDGEFGIVGGYKDYSLVKKKLSYRTGTSEDGENEGKVIEYEAWQDYPCYVSTLEGIFESYIQILNLTEFKTKKMRSTIGELVGIHQRTDNMVSEALKGIDAYLSQEQSGVCNLADTKQRLLNDIKELQQQKDTYIKLQTDINRMYNEIKEARTIIVDRDKPKKHRIKEEK